MACSLSALTQTDTHGRNGRPHGVALSNPVAKCSKLSQFYKPPCENQSMKDRYHYQQLQYQINLSRTILKYVSLLYAFGFVEMLVLFFIYLVKIYKF